MTIVELGLLSLLCNQISKGCMHFEVVKYLVCELVILGESDINRNKQLSTLACCLRMSMPK